jgi:hypothetical protein
MVIMGKKLSLPGWVFVFENIDYPKHLLVVTPSSRNQVIYWKGKGIITNKATNERIYLPFWKYGDRPGASALLFGIDMDTLSFVEIPFKNIRRIEITGQRTIRCSGSPAHFFTDSALTWKFCPICGQPIKSEP